MTAPCVPVEMPDLRSELMAKWATSTGWRMAEMQATKRQAGALLDVKNIDAGIAGQVEMLNKAELYWVGAEMCELLFATSRSVPSDVTALDLVWPSQFGFIVFAAPWMGMDAHDDENHVRVDAISWGRMQTEMAVDNRGSREVRDTLTVSFYRCIRWDDGLAGTELQLATSMGLPMEASRSAVVSRDGRIEARLTGTSWMPLGRSTWPVGDAIDARELIDMNSLNEQEESQVRSMIEDRELMAALFTLLNTHSVAHIGTEQPPRHIARREQRAGRKEPSQVKVVYLRRPEHEREPGDAEHRVNYSHRWMVSAHWRNQPYGPGRAKRRLQLIPAHVKGPDDKPVIVKSTVKAWVR